MSSTSIYPYTTPSNYTYDTDKVEITGGYAILKDQRPSGATFGANYNLDTSGDANWASGSTTVTTFGGATVSGNLLQLRNATDKVSYSVTDNADHTQIFSVGFKWTPNYSGSPGTEKNLVTWFTSGHNDLVSIQHSLSGNIQCVVRDTSGTLIVNLLSSLSVVSGTEYEILVCIDITNGNSSMYIDKTRVDTDSSTGTRNAATTFYLGGNYTGGANGIGDIDEVIIYDKVLESGASYSNSYSVIDALYPLDNPSILTNSAIDSSDLLTFSETVIKSGSDTVKWIINVGGSDYWNNGGSVASSNGTYSQANTEAEINAVIGDFVNSKQEIKFKAFLHSDDGFSYPQLDALTITYDAVLPTPTINTIVDVDGYLYGTDGQPLSNQLVKARPYLYGKPINGVFVSYDWINIGTTELDGFLDAKLMYLGESNKTEIKIGSQSYSVLIPDSNQVDWSDLEFALIED